MTIQEKFNKITDFLRFLNFQQTFHAKALATLAEKAGISLEDLAKEFDKELVEIAKQEATKSNIIVPDTTIIK